MAKNWDELDAESGLQQSDAKPPGPASFDDLDAEIEKRYTAQPGAQASPVIKPPLKDEDFAGTTLQFGPLDTRIPLPGSVARGLAQLGSGFDDYRMGYKQMTGQATAADADAKRQVDKPLLEGVLGTVNNAMGKILPAVAIPAGWAPRAAGALAPVMEGVATGALQGAFEPTGTGDSRGANMAVGAGAGAVLPAMFAGARQMGKVDAPTRALIQSAEREGIPLGTADTSQNKLIRAFRSLANDLPITGGANAAEREAQQEAFNRAMGSRWGSTASKHTPDVRDADKQRIVTVLDDVWKNNNLPYDANLFGSLRQLEHKASLMPEQEGKSVLARIQDIESKVIADPQGNLYIPGDAVNSYQKDLFKKFGKSNDERGSVMMELRGNLIDNFNSSVSGKDAARLTEARKQYRAFKSQEDALVKGDVGIAGRQVGDIRPVDASAGVNRTYKGNQNPFGDLPQIGQRFMRDTTPQTGGSARALLQNAGLGGGALLGAYSSPMAAAAGAGAFVGMNKALTSPAIRKMIQNPVVTRALLDNPSTAAATREALQNGMRRAPAGAALGALSRLSPASAEEE